MSWHVYEDVDHHFELPFKFLFDNIDSDYDNQNNFKEIITPHVLPANLLMGKSHQSFEYYHPAIATRQLGFGQGRIKLHFADLVQPRDLLPSAIDYDRLKNLSPPRESIDLSSWRFSIFTTTSFKTWWQEWRNHLFCHPMQTYCLLLNADFFSED